MKSLLCALLGLGVVAAIPAGAADVARYILPPGNFGGIPFTVNSTDQLPLYSGLSPLRDNINATDITNYYLAEDFKPVGATQAEPITLPGLQVVYDSYGIAHV